MNLTLDITECYICNNFRNIIQKSHTITSSSTTITLANCYELSIISYSSNSIVVLIQNDNNIFIRTIYPSYTFELSLNQNNICYTLSINLKFN